MWHNFCGGFLLRAVFASVLCLAVASSSATRSSARLSIAVLDLSARGISTDEASVLSDKLRTEFIGSGRYDLMEREQMNIVLKEQGFQQIGCTSEACAVEAGQLIGVRQIVTGSIGKVGSTFLITIKMVDVTTGMILISVDHTLKSDIDELLTKGIPDIVRKFVNTGPIVSNLDTVIHGVSSLSPDSAVASTNRNPARSARSEDAFPAVTQEQPGPGYGTLNIAGTPSGAVVFLDGVRRGLTPLMDRRALTGPHKVRIEMPGHIPFIDTVVVTDGILATVSYFLQGSRDSTATIGMPQVRSPTKPLDVSTSTKPQRRRHVTPKVLFGLAALSSGTIGLVMNRLAQDDINKSVDIKRRYEDSGSNQTYDQFDSAYREANKSGHQHLLVRNMCYVVSGAAVAAFAVSFAF